MEPGRGVVETGREVGRFLLAPGREVWRVELNPGRNVGKGVFAPGKEVGKGILTTLEESLERERALSPELVGSMEAFIVEEVIVVVVITQAVKSLSSLTGKSSSLNIIRGRDSSGGGGRVNPSLPRCGIVLRSIFGCPHRK